MHCVCVCFVVLSDLILEKRFGFNLQQGSHDNKCKIGLTVPPKELLRGNQPLRQGLMRYGDQRKLGAFTLSPAAALNPSLRLGELECCRCFAEL